MQRWPGQRLIVALFIWLLLPAGPLFGQDSLPAGMRHAMGFFDEPLNRSDDLFSELSDAEFALLEEYRQAYNRQIERAHNLALKAEVKVVAHNSADVEPGTVIGFWKVDYAARFQENQLHMKLGVDWQSHNGDQMDDYGECVTLIRPDQTYFFFPEEMSAPRAAPRTPEGGLTQYRSLGNFRLDYIPQMFPYSTEFCVDNLQNLLANRWRFQWTSPKVLRVQLEPSEHGEIAVVDWEATDRHARWTKTCRFLRKYDWTLLETKLEISRPTGKNAIVKQRCDYDFDASDGPILRYAVIEEFERKRQGTGAEESFGEPVLVERVEVNYHEYTPGGGDDLALYDPDRIATDAPTGFHFARSTQNVLVYLLLGSVAYYGWRHYRLA